MWRSMAPENNETGSSGEVIESAVVAMDGTPQAYQQEADDDDDSEDDEEVEKVLSKMA